LIGLHYRYSTIVFAGFLRDAVGTIPHASSENNRGRSRVYGEPTRHGRLLFFRGLDAQTTPQLLASVELSALLSSSGNVSTAETVTL